MKYILYITFGLLMFFVIFLTNGCIDNEKTTNNDTSTDLAEVVNFLINNKGEEIILSGEKQKITGDEELAVVVQIEGCCCEETCQEGVNIISAYGKVKGTNYDEGTVNALIPAEKIAEVETSNSILEINFDHKAKDYWMQVLK